MSSSRRPTHISLPSTNILSDSALDVSTPKGLTPASGRVGPNSGSRPRVSFTQPRAPRPSYGSQRRLFRNDIDEPAVSSPGKPPIPTPGAVANSSSLPKLSMTVLSITMLGEFLSANVSTPFLLFMVEGFGNFKDEADVGYWTGILVSAFFVTQFLTSLLWATVAEKHGQRTVLFVSLIGSALTCAIFGTSSSLQEAIAIRLLQGIFAGAIGVARSSVTLITDPSNEGRAYAILGFCWGLGGVLGAIIGGTFESPSKKWPSMFRSGHLFTKYPYLLPCLIASSITFTGAILALFLAPDGGPRRGAIALTPEKDDEQEQEQEENGPKFFNNPGRKVQEVTRRVSKKLSGYFARRVQQAHEEEPDQAPEIQLSVSSPVSKPRTISRRTAGSAYGYGASRNRRESGFSFASGAGRSSVAEYARRRRRNTGLATSVGDEATGQDLNLAQRMLMANEFTVTSMADLWVNAAITADEDPFVSDSEGSEVDFGGVEARLDELNDNPEEPFSFSPPVATPTQFGRHLSAVGASIRKPSRIFSNSQDPTSRGTPPRPSIGGTSPRKMSGLAIPTIFSNTGVRTPPNYTEAVDVEDTQPDPFLDSLPRIEESQSSLSEARNMTLLKSEVVESPSIWKQLPIAVIIQYGLLALHSTTHDQVFLSYLVSPYGTGGLGLNAAHFAQLIALMCLAQIAYQFYLYPNIGPPRGRFSHLAMFRIGSALFIPAYLSVTLYRAFASPGEDGNLVVMTLLALSTAVRYCGSTFAYTSIAILLNYMSPPEVNGLANGVAQSIVSLARFIGPVLGGYLWSMSIENSSSHYSLGFLVVSGVAFIAIAFTFFIR